MIASNGLGGRARVHDAASSTLSRVPQRSFGDTSWVSLALQGCTQLLTPAIRSGKSHRIAAAVRAIAHAPTPEQVDDVVGAACDALLAEAYAVHDVHSIANVANALAVIEPVLAELHERVQRDALAPALLRESVDAYVRIVALVDQRLAQSLDAVGTLAARIGYTMHQSSSTLLELELAGRLHGIGMLAAHGTEAGQQYPLGSEKFLHSVPALAHLAPIVRSHRERFDGRGFPDGLSGEEIPFASRVIGVAAAFIEFTTESPERERVSPSMACRKLAAGGGTQFDPRIVAATLSLLRFRQRTNRSA